MTALVWELIRQGPPELTADLREVQTIAQMEEAAVVVVALTVEWAMKMAITALTVEQRVMKTTLSCLLSEKTSEKYLTSGNE